MTAEDITHQLKELRDAIARTKKIEPFKVLTNDTIQAIVGRMPRTQGELIEVKGIGKKKAEEFGGKILAIVNETEQPSLFSGSSVVVQEPEGSVVFRVSKFLDYVNARLCGEAARVGGEVSGFQLHPSGAYFSLKDSDDSSILNCYMRPWAFRSLGIALEDGMAVTVTGSLEVYKAKGKLSFQVVNIELVGEGALRRAYELLKRQLEAEGLFERKRTLPEFVSSVGVVTSRTGAVIDDFRKNLEWCGIKIFLYDARVEGARAVDEVCAGIRYFNARKPDMDALVVIRGGGSLEDLQAFNNERVAREIFCSKIPTLVGIGHDRDIPIAALVADRAVSTPSVAAMTINATWKRLGEQLPYLEGEIWSGFERRMDEAFAALAQANDACVGFMRMVMIHYASLARRISGGARSVGLALSAVSAKADHYMKQAITSWTSAYERIVRAVQAREQYVALASPERNLKLGYSILFSKKGNVIKYKSDVATGDMIRARLADGEIKARVQGSN